jgi:hypothetical protein
MNENDYWEPYSAYTARLDYDWNDEENIDYSDYDIDLNDGFQIENDDCQSSDADVELDCSDYSAYSDYQYDN